MRQFAATIVAAGAFVWSLIVGGMIWSTPVRFSGVEWAASPTGARAIERVEYRSFSDISALGVVPLVVPVLLAGWATWAAWRRRTIGLVIATVIFFAFCIIAGLSIGGEYIPIGLVLVAAVLLGMLGRVTTHNRETAV
jgi:hypothetical protein